MIKELTKNEREILEHFTEKPEKIHIRGLSEELEMPYPSVRKALKDLEEKGFLESDKKSKMTFYSPKGEKFRKAKKLINLEKLEDSGLIEFLEKELRPEAAVLFGSYLEGRDKPESDIDIAVISGRDTEPDLSDFEEKLGREIQLTRVENLKEESTEFRNTLANGLVLQGYLEVV
jgi:predicted nucleotidyltransferase